VATHDSAADFPPKSWRDQAVARSLDSARARAEVRVQRFLDAALDLMQESDGKDFTVQEVVERSGQSLRSFYQYFGGKQELLLALFEESVRSTAEHLLERIGDEEDPRERLHAFVVEYYRLCRPAPKGKASKKRPTPPLIEFAQQLLTAHPVEASRAFAPVVSLFEEVLDDAAEAGVVRPELRRRSVAGVALEAIMFNTFSRTISGSSEPDLVDPAEELWDVLFRGIGATS
jgi:AcrR family transcriptional regulator